MRPRLPLVLALVALFLVVVFLAGLPEDPHVEDLDLGRVASESVDPEAALDVPVDVAPPAGPQLVGRAEHEAELEEQLAGFAALPGMRKPKHWVQGVVVDADGAPVGGARVYQLAGPAGKQMAVLSIETTNVEGRFRLPTDQWEGTTFAARSAAHGAVFVSAADARPDDELRLVLPRPMDLRVLVVRPDGSGMAGVSVTVEPLATRRPGVYLEEPDTPEHAQMGVTDAGGVAPFHFARPEPVRVTPEIVDATFDPPFVVLERPEGHVTFEAREGCRLVLQVLDTETGEHLREVVHVTIHDVATWEQIDGFRTDDSADEIDETLALGPGHYAIELTARGREPELVSDIVVEMAGQRIEREVRMQPMPRPAELVLGFAAGEAPAPATLKVGHALYPYVLLQRLDGGHAVRGYQTVGVSLDPAGSLLRITLRPGRYEGVLVLSATNEVAMLRQLLLSPGEETPYQVSPRRGTTLALADLVPEGVRVERARVEVPGRPNFPLVGRGLGAQFSGEESLLRVLAHLAKLPKAKRQEVIFGPYPPGGATIVVTDTQGNTHRATTR